MNVYFRLDCNETIGSGHFFRSIAIAKQFILNNHKVFFITCKLDSANKKILNNFKIKHIEIKKKFLLKNEEFNFLSQIILSLKNTPDLLIIDHYNILFNVQKKLKKIIPKLIIIKKCYG